MAMKGMLGTALIDITTQFRGKNEFNSRWMSILLLACLTLLLLDSIVLLLPIRLCRYLHIHTYSKAAIDGCCDIQLRYGQGLRDM